MVASCWLFLYDLYYDARNHEHQVYDLAFVLYGCETWSVMLKIEYGLKMFKNRWFRSTFGPKREKVIEEWIELRNEELYDFCFSPSLIQVIKSMRVTEA